MRMVPDFAKIQSAICAVLLSMLLVVGSGITSFAQTDPLPSWNEGAGKKSITDFVAKVTAQGGAEFVPAAERIAVFDNDGKPNYFRAIFALDRVKAMAPDHPEWNLQGDVE